MRLRDLIHWRGALVVAALFVLGVQSAAAEPWSCKGVGLAPVPLEQVLPTEVFFDPFLLRAGGRIYAFGSNWGHLNVPVAATCDFASWTRLRTAPAADAPYLDALPIRPAWVQDDVDDRIRPDLWAPEVIKAGGSYRMYFSARHRRLRQSLGSARECIGVAVSRRPDRDFIPRDAPLVCGGIKDGVIDPSPFRWKGRLFLYYKIDGNCCGHPAVIYVQRLDAAGLRLSGRPTALLANRPKTWELDRVEAPTMVSHAGRFVLFYSGGRFEDASYAVGYALCNTPMGPCSPESRTQLLKSDLHAQPELRGPGHQSVLEMNGRTFLAFHALVGAGADSPRSLRVRELHWCGAKPALIDQPC